MGIFKAGVGSIGGTLADQWLETVEPQQMDNSTIASYGVPIRNDKRSSNRKGTSDIISNGSIIHVPENVFMLLVDGGKIVAATDDPGYYQVDNARPPSIFFRSDSEELEGYGKTGRRPIKRPGGIINTIKDSWERFKFGGTTPLKQRVIYINKQEIPDIRFGTKTPVSYTDRVLVPGRVVPTKVTSFGTYSIKIVDPLLFYSEVCSKTGKNNITVSDMAEQYINEFLMAYTTALASLSQDMVLVTDIPIKTMELGLYMADILDKEWLSKRGFLIHSVGIAGIDFDEKTSELLDRYASDAILIDPNARAARMTGSLAKGLEAAGSNEGGAMLGFAGMAMGMNAAGAMGVMPNQQVPQGQPYQQPQPPMSHPGQVVGWTCMCGNTMPNDSAFCAKCGNKKPSQASPAAWTCSCGRGVSEGNFCPNCGQKRPEQASYKCDKCGYVPEDSSNIPNFCPKCGDPFNEDDKA